MKLFSYNGQMQFQKLNDACIRTNYQHEHIVKTYRDLIEGKKVLDAGCWTGTLEGEIVRENINCELTGSDINKEALGVARKAFPNFAFFEIDLANPSGDIVSKYKGYFDTIIILDVIEHVPAGQEEKVLSTLCDFLKPSGTLILSTMNSHLLNFIDPAWFLGHRHYSTNQIKEMLSKSGLVLKGLNLIGNVAWDVDLLMLYIFKHIFHKQWTTPTWLFREILKGLSPRQLLPTRIYLLAAPKI